MSKVHISAFLLERYHIGEVSHEEKTQIDEALAHDKTLASALADLDRKDNDFFRQFPVDKFFPEHHIIRSDEKKVQRKSLRSNLRRINPAFLGICAAALVVVISLPLLIFNNSAQTEFGDRMKGASADNGSIELSVYVREDVSGESVRLSDNSGISEGNTIQLVYRVSGAEKYGVIFSIDGRAYVTMHYPYTPWQSTLLVSGRAVPLEEAFTLDDAPDYEIFFFVAGDDPVDIRDVLSTAGQLALLIEDNPMDALRIGTAAFSDYELKVFTLIKE
ncbi:MAG: hypothetical protein FWD40_01750 [Treponema sp.]|nr:hypothetical protein [Treponema sp.]